MMKSKKSKKRQNKSRKNIKRIKGGFEKKSIQSRVGWRQLNCSPAVKGETVSDKSCMVPAVLAKIKREYNKRNSANPITQEDPVGIWQELHKRLQHCNDEKCWLKIIDDSNDQHEIKDNIFRPDQPKEWAKNPDEWLSNYDIFNVVKQYEDEYPDFKILGPSAIDFAKVLKTGQCVNVDMCKFSLKDWMQKGKRNFGFCFNLDKHDEPGSHWVSLYLHVPENLSQIPVGQQKEEETGQQKETGKQKEEETGKQKEEETDETDHPFVFYFDSAGNSVPKEVRDLMNNIVKQGKEMNIEFKQYNNAGHDHQQGNTECGMYSIFFIITMLIGNTPFHPEHMTIQDRIDLFKSKKNKIGDKVVFDYRDLYFNP
jgi:hypothetical protein